MSAGIVIVGTGHAGIEAAAAVRSAGYDGPVTLLGAERDHPYQRPPLSKGFLADPDAAGEALRAPAFFEKKEITLRLGAQVAAIDRQARSLDLTDGERVSYDSLVLALGSRPRHLPVPGAELAGVHVLRSLADARGLRGDLQAAESIAVIGGGFIGLEVAATARKLGKAVTVLEAGERLMGRAVVPAVSDFFRDRHRAWGTRVALGTTATAFAGADGRVRAVETGDGDTVTCDLVLVCVGIVPETGLAESAGLSVDDGVQVDSQLITDDPAITAAGDCVRFPSAHTGTRIRLESVQNAADQGRTAARAAVGRPERYSAVPWFWSDQGDVRLQMAGLPIHVAETVTREEHATAFSLLHYDGDGRLVAVDSVNRPRDHMAARRLLAAGATPSPSRAADPGYDLKQAMPAR